MVRHPAWYIAAAALGIVTWWAAQPEQVEEFENVDLKEERVIDYFVRNLDATSLDESGKPSRRIVAQELRHFPDDDSTLLQLPVIHFHRPNLPPWYINAKNGTISADGNLVLLAGKVIIESPGSEKEAPVRMDTRPPRDSHNAKSGSEAPS